ncbi:hypothetical protein [Tautonia rosea]|uniref:hypothetical protein n=1 Tax=Tautonia rosea TaxID=2728037 RepID=UPI0014750CD9|nr:hypothetical protein [Tautonia rosea]
MRRNTATQPSPCWERPRLVRSVVLILLMMSSGCSTLATRHWAGGATGTSLIPTRYHAEVGAFRVASNLPMTEDDPALQALAGLEDRLERVLGVKVEDDEPPIDVYILDDNQAFTTFLMFHHPELPNRRAFFLAVGDVAAVYTARGSHLEEDLRHEATHALLHRAVGHVPLWLDEGLAEYFEVQPQALPTEAVARFRKLAGSYREGWRPDLKRLEAVEQVAVMSPTDYREAWAWTVLLLHGPRRQSLVAHLEQLRTEGELAPSISERLRKDLAQLNRQFLAQVSPSDHLDSPRLTRLQSPPTSPRTVAIGGTVSTQPRVIVVTPSDPGLPFPNEPPRGPIGRLREGIGNFFNRLIP